MQASKNTSQPIEQSVPARIVIGVTGHLKLTNEELLRKSVKKVLAKLDKILTHTTPTFIVVSSLAEGAARLVAWEVLEWPVAKGTDKPELEVVLLAEDYLQTSETQESKDEFRSLLERAVSVKTLGKAVSPEKAYEQVDYYVVDNCDVIVAIWNEKLSAEQCVTAKTVEYGRKVGRYIFLINSENGKLEEERHEAHTLESIEHLGAYNNERFGYLDQATVAEYNLLAEKATKSDSILSYLGLLRKNLLPQFVRANLLAQRYQSYHTKAGIAVYALAATAVATVTVQTLFFPLHSQILWFEVVWMAIILGLLGAARHWDWHRKWIDYRFLAERLRAALFLHIAGIECESPKPLPYLSLFHSPPHWVVKAFAWIWNTRLKTQLKIPFEPLKEFLLTAWIKDQVSYYKKTSKRYKQRHMWLTFAGVVLFVLTLVAAVIHAVKLVHSLDFLLPNILSSIAIILPAVSAALYGIQVHQEYLRSEERYRRMGDYLSKFSNHINHVQDLQTLTDLVKKADKMMLHELQDWRGVLIFPDLVAPP